MALPDSSFSIQSLACIWRLVLRPIILNRKRIDPGTLARKHSLSAVWAKLSVCLVIAKLSGATSSKTSAEGQKRKLASHLLSTRPCMKGAGAVMSDTRELIRNPNFR
jgi:hypothetical protein